jgi:uncharacterized protein YkwD
MKRRFFPVSVACMAFFVSLVSFTRAGEDIIKDILNYTNSFRTSRGLPELIDRDDLNAIAEKHSADMASGRVDFGHDGFEQRQQQAKAKLTTIRAFAENVAYGAKSGEEVVTLWKNSLGHRRNMLGKYKYVGIGTATDSRGRIYYTQIFAD